jgi:RHS repeat-associated protein
LNVNLDPLERGRTCQYDGNGNRVYDSRNGGAVLIADQLLADQTAIYGSDDLGLGRRTSVKHGQAAENFEYRPDGLMTRYTKTEGYGPGLKTTDARYTFDAFGRRVAKSLVINGSSFSQVFRYFGDSSEILLAKAGNGDEYLYMKDQGTGEPYAEIGPTGAKSYVKDHLGSVLNSEAAGGKMAYGSFGELLGATPVLSATTNPYMPSYAGYMYDAESDSYHTEHRAYNPDTGRFLQRDPSGFGGGDTNLYRYAFNSPTSYIDPSGLKTTVIITSDFGIGSHAAVFTDAGGGLLYDPGGSYQSTTRGTGGYFTGSETSLAAYLAYQKSTGSTVQTYSFDTTPSQEMQIQSNVVTGLGGNTPFKCTLGVCAVLQGVGPFQDLQSNVLPGSLANQLDTLLTLQNQALTCGGK